MYIFQVEFYDFWQEFCFLDLLMIEKMQGIFFTSKKETHCGTLLKMQNMNTINVQFIFLLNMFVVIAFLKEKAREISLISLLPELMFK